MVNAEVGCRRSGYGQWPVLTASRRGPSDRTGRTAAARTSCPPSDRLPACARDRFRHRRERIAGSVLALLLLASPVAAERPLRPGIGSTDERVAVDSASWPWRAIGRLNRSGGGFCTATLIAPAAVLTAAHCLWDPRRGARALPQELHFLAGYRRGEFAAHGIGARIETPAEAAPPASPFGVAALPEIAHDWAIVHLREALPVRPIPLASRSADGAQPITRVGYGQDRPHLLAMHKGCRILDRLPTAPLLLTDCDATRGDSGSPVLQGDGDQLRIVGITAAVADDGHHTASIVIDAAAMVKQLPR
jgi:V8-like Glu-specific endopeptidase